MIRDAMLSDIPALIEMGRRFHAATVWNEVAAFDELSFENTITRLITDPDGILLVDGSGMIGGVLFPLYFNRDHKAVQELIWWFERKRGVKLMKSFEERAREMGASSMVMASVEPLKSPENLYLKRGYRTSERLYIKDLH